MKQRQVLSQYFPMCFLMVSSSDHISGVAGLIPTVALSGGGGTGFVGVPYLITVTKGGGALDSQVAGVAIIDGGSSYTSAPTVSFSGGSGSGAAATAQVSGGAVTGITITDSGSGYSPVVTQSLPCDPLLGLRDEAGVFLSPTAPVWAVTTGRIFEIGNGWYGIADNASDRGSLGELLLHATATGADPADEKYGIVPWNPYGPYNMGLTALPANTNLANFWTNGARAGTVNTVTSKSQFTLNASLTTQDNDYAGVWLCFTSGLNSGISRVIGAYTGANKQVQFTGSGVKGAFPETVATGDSFMMLAGSN